MGLIALVAIVTVFCVYSVTGGHMVFQIPTNDRQCFYQNLEKGVEFEVVCQVISGAGSVVDFEVVGPNDENLFRETQAEFSTYTWNVTAPGTFGFCITSEVSSFTDTRVYLDAYPLNFDYLKPNNKHQAALTQLEKSHLQIMRSMDTVEAAQTQFRNREMGGRMYADYLNSKVFYWSIGQLVLVLITGIGQVILMRSFFTDKKSSRGQVYSS